MPPGHLFVVDTEQVQEMPLATKEQKLIPLLLIDDDIELGEMMREYFSSHGYGVLAIPHGSAGLQKALDEEFALVILDVMLPGMDGFNVLRQFRKRSSTPVIMLTARVTESDRIAGLDGGADDYLTKPFGPAELLARIRAVLRRSGATYRCPSKRFQQAASVWPPQTALPGWMARNWF